MTNEINNLDNLKNVTGGSKPQSELYTYIDTLIADMRIAKGKGWSYSMWYSRKFIELTDSVAPVCECEFVEYNYHELETEWMKL